MPPDPKSNPEHPEFNYSGTEELIRIEKAMIRYNEWIVSKVIKGYGRRVGEKDRVLDFGAGLGTLSQIFYEKTGVKPDALEADPGHRVETARRGFATYSHVPELQGHYDLIFVSNVLEHIVDDTGALASLKPYLKSDGVLVIYIPAFQALWTPMDDKVGHIRRYRKQDLAGILRDAGYRLEKMGYCDSLGFFLTLVFKFLGNSEGDLPMRALYIYDRLLLPLSKLMDMLCAPFFGKNLFVVVRAV